jgi:short-subunit dehydrogenase
MKDLKGKTVLITGAARGMGKLHAENFAREGCRIILTDLDGEELARTESAMKAKGYQVFAYEHDVSDYDKCVELASRVEKEVGPVDVLINNAGIVRPEPVLDMSAAAFSRITGVNYLGSVWMMKAFVPGMVSRKSGHVVNIGSQAAKMGVPNLGAYCGTKFAMVGVTDAIRQEVAGTGVHFTLVHPGYASTGMFEGVKVPFVTSWLDPQHVADELLRGVKKNKAEVFVPRLLTWFVGFGRGLGMPKLADFLMIVMGAKGSTNKMDKDRGRVF